MARERMIPEQLQTTPLGEGDWLRLDRIQYRDSTGRVRTWETASRQRQQGAVLMIPVLRPSGRFVLIRQFRAPVNAFVLEFPAGLIDPGEDPAATATRELLEETGYRGTIAWMGSPTLSSPGMTAESVVLALMDIHENSPDNAAPTQTTEDGEDIEVVLATRDELPDLLHRQSACGAAVDSRTAAFFLGMGITW